MNLRFSYPVQMVACLRKSMTGIPDTRIKTLIILDLSIQDAKRFELDQVYVLFLNCFYLKEIFLKNIHSTALPRTPKGNPKDQVHHRNEAGPFPLLALEEKTRKCQSLAFPR